MIASAGEQVVVVVAHPDDETFGCGSLIAAAVAAGATVTVLCATLGEEGEREPDPATDHLPLGEVRDRELRAAGDVLGVSAIELLGHRDSGFDGPLPDGALCGVSVDDLARSLAKRLDELGADVVVTIDGSDGHRDHTHVRAAVESAAALTVRRPRLVMASLANSLMRRWAAEMAALRPDMPYLDIDLDQLGVADHLLTPIDNSPVLDLRERAIACHRSQRSPYDDISPELRRAFLATDHVFER